jgi:hypothetical protein
MFVYFCWPKNGGYNAMAFHKENSAIEYVFSTISELINYNRNYKPKPKKIKKNNHLLDVDIGEGPIAIEPPQVQNIFLSTDISATTQQEEENLSEELLKLKKHMEFSLKNKTFENAKLAIKLYEEYSTYVLLQPSAIHTLQDLKVVK